MIRNQKSSLRHSWLAVLLLMFGLPFSLAANDRLDDLRSIQSKVQSVVSKNMESCVAITDGIGFGSGALVSEDGLILTAGHVISSPARRFEIIFPSGKRMEAVKLGMNLNVDAGMLKIVDGRQLPFVELAESAPKSGDWVVSLGHSGGFELGRKPPVRTGKFLRQSGFQLITDAVLIGGDSGGPLFNLDGELIGIHSSIGGTVAENRHIRIDAFRDHWTRMADGETWGKLPTLKASERKARDKPRLGVTVDTRLNNGVILSIEAGSPAEKAGLLPNDRVIEFAGEKITSSRQLIRLVGQKKVGEVCSLTVERKAQRKQFIIVMALIKD